MGGGEAWFCAYHWPHAYSTGLSSAVTRWARWAWGRGQQERVELCVNTQGTELVVTGLPSAVTKRARWGKDLPHALQVTAFAPLHNCQGSRRLPVPASGAPPPQSTRACCTSCSCQARRTCTHGPYTRWQQLRERYWADASMKAVPWSCCIPAAAGAQRRSCPGARTKPRPAMVS